MMLLSSLHHHLLLQPSTCMQATILCRRSGHLEKTKICALLAVLDFEYLQSWDIIIIVTVNQETLDPRHPSQLLNNMWFCMYMCVCLSVVTQMCVGSECILLCGIKGKAKMSFLRSHLLGVWNRTSQMSWNSQILLGELVSVSFLGIFFSASLVLGWTHRQPQETFPADSGGHTQVFCR